MDYICWHRFKMKSWISLFLVRVAFMNAMNANTTSGDIKALHGKASTSRQMQNKSKRHPKKGVEPFRFKIHIIQCENTLHTTPTILRPSCINAQIISWQCNWKCKLYVIKNTWHIQSQCKLKINIFIKKSVRKLKKYFCYFLLKTLFVNVAQSFKDNILAP